MGLFIDGDDERLEQRYMGTLRRYPSAGEPLFVIGSGSSANWTSRYTTALIW